MKKNLDKVGKGGGQVKKGEVEETKKKTLPPEKGAERRWKPGEKF
jgi:hypothetical protein